jgi:LPS export ABC transporter protein LptC
MVMLLERVDRRLILLVASLAVMTGCQEQPVSDQQAPPFVLRSLSLNQRKPDGSRDWDLNSPEARYDLDSRTVRAKRPSGLLYKADQPGFRISADLATVLNDGELVVLEGNVRLQQLNQRRILIQGQRLVWTPNRSLMVLEQQPVAVDDDSRLTSPRLEYRTDTDKLVFQGPARLHRWDKRRTADHPPDTLIQVERGSWNLATGRLKAAGPVLGKRQPDRSLLASRLEGNTKAGYLDLVEPVRVRLGESEDEIQAGRTRWNYERREFRSAQPFTARFKTGEARGTGFILDEAATTVTVPQDCRLNQPGEQLRAQRCRWNWTTERVRAEGDVEVRREELQQITRAPVLDGQIGEDGNLRFRGGGERVRSQIRLAEPTRQQQPASPAELF